MKLYLFNKGQVCHCSLLALLNYFRPWVIEWERWEYLHKLHFIYTALIEKYKDVCQLKVDDQWCGVQIINWLYIYAGIVNFKFKDFYDAVDDLSACVKLDKDNMSALTYLVSLQSCWFWSVGIVHAVLHTLDDVFDWLNFIGFGIIINWWIQTGWGGTFEINPTGSEFCWGMGTSNSGVILCSPRGMSFNYRKYSWSLLHVNAPDELSITSEMIAAFNCLDSQTPVRFVMKWLLII